jgi:hypothetical protein
VRRRSSIARKRGEGGRFAALGALDIETPMQALASSIEYWQKHPVGWIKKFIDPPFVHSEDQISLAQAMAEQEKDISAVSGQCTGKTTIIAELAIWAFVCFPQSKVVLTAPSAGQLNVALWPALMAIITQNEDLDRIIDVNQIEARMKGESVYEWGIYKRSVNQPESLQGVHGQGGTFFFVDEASGVEDDIFRAIEGGRASKSEISKLVMISQGTRPYGYFYDSHHGKADFYKLFRFASTNSPICDQSWCRRQAESYGKNSLYYQVYVAGGFPEQHDNCIIDAHYVYEAVHRQIELGEPIRMGLDPARHGRASAVIAVAHGDRMERITEKPYTDTVEVEDMAKREVAIIREAGITSRIIINVDESGVGGGVLDHLKLWVNDLSLNIEINGHINNWAAKDNHCDKWGDELWYAFSKKIKEVSLPDDPDLIAQLINRQYEVPKGKIKLVPKEDAPAAQKKSGLKVTKKLDKADAVVLAFAPPYIGHEPYARPPAAAVKMRMSAKYARQRRNNHAATNRH